MSSCAASYCTCFPRASSASATSASSPTGAAPLSYRCAAQHSALFHPRPNQKHPRPGNRALFGFVPTVADRWQSSNALPLPRSNSVPHPCESQLPHETAVPIPKSLPAWPHPSSCVSSTNPSLLPAVSPRPLPPLSFFAHSQLPATLLVAPAHRPGIPRYRSSAPFNFHRPASAASASGFLLTALSNARLDAALTSTFS